MLQLETWVSGTGSRWGELHNNGAVPDVCLFAHDQTSNNGAINVLTSGNFGPLDHHQADQHRGR